MFSINPNVSALLNVGVAVAGALGGATAEFTTLLGQGPGAKMAASAALAALLLGSVNSALHGLSSNKPGVLAS
jgi:hypothetical protein